MDWLIQYPIAHRGLHMGFTIPENSNLAFKKALEKNYAIELDIRITKDNQVVVFHDKNLLRICASKKKIANQAYSNLKKFNLYHTSEKIPLLSEVLELINGQVPVLIEVKNYGTVGLFEELLSKELENYKGHFAVCSFNVEVINWFKQNKPDIKRGLIFGDLKKFQIKFYKIVFLYRLFTSKPDFISLDYKLLDTFLVNFCRFFNKPLVSWTIDSKKKLRKARHIVDNIIFENIKIKKDRS
ncbi:glycerophosphodiester phosphodiesterase family protein [Arcobacter sp. LA11]|uniref:glycerophosphodiester phosphodiesterase family protein n=1 Tax=Arcobacter sp. LA11 TaxID=1898176 RepID=UPI0009FB36D5|nr:glycerophosphodiester phosphodiesterase family protein [Arcobacter sp. LA11]